MNFNMNELDNALAEAFEYNGKSIAEWKTDIKRIEKQNKAKQEKENLKLEEARNRSYNIEQYRQQVEQRAQYDSHGQFIDLSSELDRSNVHVNEYKQNRAELNFATAVGIELDE
jgi:hypothetical protein